MLKQFYIFCFLIGINHFVQAQHLQLVENRGEIGLFTGQSSYRGDIAPDKFLFNKTKGAFYKKQYNDYAGFRLNYEQIQLGAHDSVSDNSYAKNRSYFFSNQFHDISMMGEFYFTRYLPGNKNYRFTPYLSIGAGYLFASNPTKNGIDTQTTTLANLKIDSLLYPSAPVNGFLYLPIQIGFKYNLTRRINLFGEIMYRFVTSDELDGLADEQLIEQKQTVQSGANYMIGGVALQSFDQNTFSAEKIGAGNFNNRYQGSRSGKDQFFSAKVGISYNLIKIYGEEKWKPGKKSKLASLKEKVADERKSGFFSRLKLNRK
jgi:hypothetical protein